MANQEWVNLANANQASSNQIGPEYKESVVLKDVSPGLAVAGQAVTVPGGYFMQGAVVRFTAHGWISTTAEPTIKLGIYWNGVNSAKPLATRKVTASAPAAESSWTMQATTLIIPQTSSLENPTEKAKAFTSGTIVGLQKSTENETTGTSGMVNIPIVQPAGSVQSGIEINTAVQNVITLGAEWGTNSASNILVVTQWMVETLN